MIPLTSHMKYSPEVAPNSFDFRRFEGDIPKPSTESVITPPKLLDETSLKGDTSNTNFRFSNATNPVLLVISSDEACSLAARFFCTKLVAYMRWCGESVKLFVASNDFNSPELTRYTHDSEEWLRQVRRCIDSSMEYYDSDPPLGFAATPVSVICADCLSAGSLAAFHELLPPERSFYIRHISFTEEVAAEAIEGCGYIDVCLPRQMLRASRCRGSVICSSVTSFLNNVLPSLHRIYRHEPLDGLPTDTLRSFAPVFFIRHGQSEYNLEDRLGGDPDLTDSGRQDAADIAEFFQQQVLTNEHLFSDRNEVWNREVGFEVRCSQLRRTRHTAAPSAAVLSTHPKTFKSLNEIHAGICEDMTNEEVKVLYPHIQSFRHSDKVGFRYPNGESYRDLARRLTPLLLDLTNTKEAVLVVAHQAVLRTVLSYFGGPPVEEAVHGPCPQRTIWACTYNRIGEPQLAEIALPPRRNKTGPTDAPAINWTGW